MDTFVAPEPVAILTNSVTGRDGDNNDVVTPTQVDTTGAFAPGGSSELLGSQDLVITQPTVYLTTGAPVPKATDRIKVRGVTYDIDGQPQVFRNPYSGETPGAVVRLKSVTG